MHRRVNFKIAEIIGLKNLRIQEPKENQLLKLVTFVPRGRRGAPRLVRSRMRMHRQLRLLQLQPGRKGTFRAQPGTHPFCGEIGQLHEEQGTGRDGASGLPEREGAEGPHRGPSYEEPAYDFYPLQNEWAQAGSGLVGELEEPETETDFLRRVKKLFEVGCVKHSRMTGRLIQKVALCGGAGAFLLPNAVGAHADVFLTGGGEISRLFQLRERHPDSRDRALRKRTIYQRFIIFNHTGEVSDTRCPADACQYQSHKILVKTMAKEAKKIRMN